MNKYLNRYEAGKMLAEQLKGYAKQKNMLVLALPRGGVPVAYEIAKALSLPLDVFIVRKLGVPGHEELAMGALASGNVTVFNEDVINSLQISKERIQEVIEAEGQELRRRELAYRGDAPFPSLTGKTILLVDDGIATGATMRAALKALRQSHPASIVIAVPVAEISTCKKMATIADKIVCPLQPVYFNAVGAWYEDFAQTEDKEVYSLLTNFNVRANTP